MIQDVAALIGIAVVLGPVLVYIVMACAKSFKAFKLVSKIAAEFENNGGSSLRDSVDALGDKLNEVIAVNKVSMDLIAYPLFQTDATGHVVWTNRSMLHELNIGESEALGLGWLSSVIEEDRQAVKYSWFDAVEDQRPVQIEFELTDGRVGVIDALPIKSKSDLTGMFGALRLNKGYMNG